MNIEDIVREGKVTAVDNGKRIAKVWFDSMGIESDWLPVLITRDFIPDYDVPQRTEFEAGGSGDPAFASHKHDLIIKPYMPKVNDLVLVLYFPVFNGDGVILGGIKPWKVKNMGPPLEPSGAVPVGRGGARERAQFSPLGGNGA